MAHPFHSRCSWLWLVVVMMALPSMSYAGAFRQLGYDTLTQSTANSNAAYGDSLGVLYTNPALLSRFPDMAQLGVTFWQPDMYVHLMSKPAGTDVPLSIYASKMGALSGERDLAQPTAFLKNQRHNTKIDDSYAYLGFGSSMSFGIPGFRFGSIMNIPIDNLPYIGAMHTAYATEYEQYFTNQVHFSTFGEWNKMVDGLMGVSYSPIKYVSIGISLRIGMSTAAKANIYMPDATQQDYSLLNNDTKLKVAPKPIVGLQIEPTDWMSLGFTWRYRSYMNVDGGGAAESYQLLETSSNYTVIKRANQKFNMAMDYEPMETTGALGFKYAGFVGNASFTWNRYSKYLDSHHQHPEDAILWAYTPLNFMSDAFNQDPFMDKDQKLTAAGKKLRDKFKWKDTVSYAFGAQYKYMDTPAYGGEIRAGFSYTPSPVPAQIGRTNYADSDTFCGSLGHRFDFELFKKKLGVDVAVQYWGMVQRKVYKDSSLIMDEFYDGSKTKIGDLAMSEAKGLQTNNPGYPGYTLGGHIVTASVNFRYTF